MWKCQIQVFPAFAIKKAFFFQKRDCIFYQIILWLLRRFFPKMSANLFQRFGCFIAKYKYPSVGPFQSDFDGFQRSLVIDGHEIHGFRENQVRQLFRLVSSFPLLCYLIQLLFQLRINVIVVFEFKIVSDF